MTVGKVLEIAELLSPSVFSDEMKLFWLNQIEGTMQTEVLLLSLEDVVEYDTDDMDSVLLVDSPYDKFYPYYVAAMMAQAMEEPEKYANHMAIHNQFYEEWVQWVCYNIRPGEGMGPI